MVETSITSIERVGSETIAVTVETPPEFTGKPGQFVLVEAILSDETAESYYTLSSPDVTDTFEITVATGPDATVGSWLAECEPGDTVTIKGPFGDVSYNGDSDVIVLAGGPGIGPAVGIGERAITEHEVTIIYQDDTVIHQERLFGLESAGASVTYLKRDDPIKLDLILDGLDVSIFVFGFKQFVDDAIDVLEAADIDIETVGIESFGPE